MSVKIKCSHILVAKQSEAIAILARIKAGEKFGKLAKELSTDGCCLQITDRRDF
jgi:foldase protein PrsA